MRNGGARGAGGASWASRCTARAGLLRCTAVAFAALVDCAYPLLTAAKRASWFQRLPFLPRDGVALDLVALLTLLPALELEQ